MIQLIEVRDIHEDKHLINPDLLERRRASYGFIVDKGRLLVQDHRMVNGKYWLVGGALEHAETPQETVIREAIEEAGQEVLVEDQLYYHEYNFFSKPGVYYRCEVDYYNCIANGKVTKPIESTPLAWLPIAEISPLSFHILIQDAVRTFLNNK